MPIKDISKEEQAHLFLTGGVKREHMQLTESDRGDMFWAFVYHSYNWTTAANFHSKLPLRYYNNLANHMYEKDSGTTLSDARYRLDTNPLLT